MIKFKISLPPCLSELKNSWQLVHYRIAASLDVGALITTRWRAGRASGHRGTRGPRAIPRRRWRALARLYRVWDAFFSFHLQTIDAVITGWAPEVEEIFARSQSDNPPSRLSLTCLASSVSPTLPFRHRSSLLSRARVLCEQWDKVNVISFISRSYLFFSLYLMYLVTCTTRMPASIYAHVCSLIFCIYL